MRTSRLQLLAAAGVAVASLALTACQDGTGTRDEGASASQPVASAPSDASSQAPEESASGSGGNGSTANGSTGSGGDTAGSGESGSGSKGSSAGKGSAPGGSDDAPATFNPCNGSNTSVSAAPVSRPVNHMLITVKNTGSKNCDLTYYPVLRFDEMQWVPQPVEESKPQAVVTLAPGESAYAGVLLSAADGSGSGGATGKKLTVGFQGRTPNSDGGPAAIPSLPAAGVYYDSSLTVTYWQSSTDDALTY
ncbi:DUF4232 domain-containing protein [Streptomyces griseoincarnatus]|uniref:DUF4232 domain-containing protein n=1 Tax=Streptomyces griseoincarnatus TaxID=29305 RepID=A0ABT0W0G9_STRGI|nr:MULTISPECIES: DUF4232 domain-containing protein [Streptomyces]MBJ6615414.1 DUF4232 domain-containing protein [Streptomyces sp. I3(2020)]MBJ6625889.1 DUF4232 domain-containing protein [Streptomyces sp. I4(2020)]MCM2516710.1 DUF4232 domain-containing protein [Streptomyces griseoincarnatus]